MRDYIKTILRGVGQVMLQNNALTGLLFLAGIFYNSWLMGLGAIAGNFISTISAKFLKYSEEDIKNGLYGFNGTLVGIAIWFFRYDYKKYVRIFGNSIMLLILLYNRFTIQGNEPVNNFST